MPPDVAAIIDTLGNKARIEILHQLAARAMTAAELADLVDAERSWVSRHLTVLEDLDLVTADRPRGTRARLPVVWQANREAVTEATMRWLAYATGRSAGTLINPAADSE